MTMNRGPESDPATNEERDSAGPGKSGLIHLAICLGITAAVIIALTLVG